MAVVAPEPILERVKIHNRDNLPYLIHPQT